MPRGPYAPGPTQSAAPRGHPISGLCNPYRIEFCLGLVTRGSHVPWQPRARICKTFRLAPSRMRARQVNPAHLCQPCFQRNRQIDTKVAEFGAAVLKANFRSVDRAPGIHKPIFLTAQIFGNPFQLIPGSAHHVSREIQCLRSEGRVAEPIRLSHQFCPLQMEVSEWPFGFNSANWYHRYTPTWSRSGNNPPSAPHSPPCRDTTGFARNSGKSTLRGATTRMKRGLGKPRYEWQVNSQHALTFRWKMSVAYGHSIRASLRAFRPPQDQRFSSMMRQKRGQHDRHA